MVELVLPILFSGMIAFVPNDYRYAEFMNAYLLNMPAGICRHAPQIEIQGCLNIEANQHCCTTDHSNFTVCDLSDTDITLSPAPFEQKKYLGVPPAVNLPVDMDAGESDSWIVRLGNVGGASRRTKGWDNGLDQLVGARFRFGWEEALTCKMDDNGGLAEVHSIEFCKLDENGKPDCQQTGISSAKPQAVAESILFKVGLPAGPVKLILTNRKDKKKSIIDLSCPSGYCPLVTISNDLVNDLCESNLDYGLHFKMYYNLLEDEGRDGIFIPHRAKEMKPRDQVSDNCRLDVYKSHLSDFCPANDIPAGKQDSRVICPPLIMNP